MLPALFAQCSSKTKKRKKKARRSEAADAVQDFKEGVELFSSAFSFLRAIELLLICLFVANGSMPFVF